MGSGSVSRQAATLADRLREPLASTSWLMAMLVVLIQTPHLLNARRQAKSTKCERLPVFLGAVGSGIQRFLYPFLHSCVPHGGLSYQSKPQ